MNLGDSDLKFVNTSRPQLVHTASKQSITASDDYYSLTSENSSNDGQTTFQRFETPPMRMRSAEQSRDALQSEATINTIRPIKHTQQGSDDSEEKLATFVPDKGDTIKRKPVSSSSQGTIVQRPVSEMSPPTPGIDDTPYIQFAIEQLTRDEEVIGSRRDGAGSEASYPVDRIIPDEGLGYYRSSAQRVSSGPPSIQSHSPLTGDDVLLPTEPTTETFRYPKLDYIPRPLRITFLSALIFCCILMIAALIFCAVWPSSHNGFLEYDGMKSSRYFVFQYLPQLLAMFIILWLLIIQSAIHRIIPFISLSTGRDTQISGVLDDAKLFPTNYLMPELAFFKHREPVLGLCSIIFWCALFTVPLQSCLFQTRYYDGIWKWTTVQPIAWTLFALYLLLVVALLLIMLRFRLHLTGLKWDPVSIADIMVLFHRSNILSDFEHSDIDDSILREERPKSLRLGYWTTSRRATEIFYCIGDENAPVRRYSLERGKMRPVNDTASLDLEGQRHLKLSTFGTLQSDLHSPAVRYRWTPWFLRDTFVVLWIVIAVVLMIAFVVVSFVNQAVLTGFRPLLPAPTTSQGFSPADFLYSFLPSFVGMVLFLLWQPIDVYFRALQPFASLASSGGATAELSLLLDYNACLPLEVTFKAVLAGHYKVAWISFVSLMSITLPVLAGGVFTAVFNVDTQDIRMAASLPGYEALVVFVVLYALSYLAIWPTSKRHLSHDISTLRQLVSYFYQSPLLAESAFKEPRSKIDLVTKLIGQPTGEKGKPQYAFGIYTGQDGREHLGIDRLGRPGSGEMLNDYGGKV